MVANEEENSNAPTNEGQTAAMETLRRCPFKPIVLNNITDGNRTVDTLHKEAYVSRIHFWNKRENKKRNLDLRIKENEI